MTTYTTIPNSSLEPGKPIRSIDGIALRDNPLAIIEGDATAPRIIGRAAKRFSDYSPLAVTAADTYDVRTQNNHQELTTATNNTNNPPTVVAHRYTVGPFTGSIRFKCSHIASASTSRLSIYKNNVLIQAYTTGTTVAARTNDVSVSPGDVIEWRHSAVSGLSYTSDVLVSNLGGLASTASDTWIVRDLYIAQSEVNRS
jgi:hypothetical protein